MKRKIILIMLLACIYAPYARSQQIRSMEFRNQSIIDILMALAEVSGTSIIPDETVSGNASFHFSDSDLFEALEIFLSQYKLFYKRDGNVIKVSRIDATWDEINERVSMRGEDVELANYIKSLSKVIGTSIIYDPLPSMFLTIEMNSVTPATALEILTTRLTDYTVITNESYFFIQKIIPGSTASRQMPQDWISRSGDLYSIDVDRARFQEIIPMLFSIAEKEYSLLTKADATLDNLHFNNKDFEALLLLILEQGNGDFVIQNDIYYILEMQHRDVIRKFKETRVIPIYNLPVQDLIALIPSELSAGNVMRSDKSTNTLILNGSPEEIAPIGEFVALIDRPLEGIVFKKFDLIYINAQDILTIIPPRLMPSPPVISPRTNSFILSGTAEALDNLAAYIAEIDRRNEGFPIRLKYIKSDELLNNLPPSITSDDILDSGYPNLIFFTGPEEKRNLFLQELRLIDKPKPQLRYELLVIEYLKHNEARVNASINITRTDELPGSSFLGKIANIMNLSFDVVTQFGYQFAADLSVQLGENLAQIFADTTLYGIAGQEIKFQNTDTYRYQEFEIDADSGSISRAGITREISSGLFVALNGWVSGDDMITISINATVSKQNNNQTSNASMIPSTSERIVNTQIRTPSGRPIILSGLLKDDTSRNVKKIPILGDIPILKYLFSDLSSIKEQTEIVIYIVPYLMEDFSEELDIPAKIERYYHSFLENI